MNVGIKSRNANRRRLTPGRGQCASHTAIALAIVYGSRIPRAAVASAEEHGGSLNSKEALFTFYTLPLFAKP